jgi:hypothetical protein
MAFHFRSARSARHSDAATFTPGPSVWRVNVAAAVLRDRFERPLRLATPA